MSARTARKDHIHTPAAELLPDVSSVHPALASLLLSLPAVKQRQAGIPQMNLRNWGGDAFVEDSWKVSTTTLNLGVRYEYASPRYEKNNTNTNLIFQNGVPSVFVGGQNGYPRGLMYANQHNFAPRLGIAKNLPNRGLVLHASYGIFFTPVDLNRFVTFGNPSSFADSMFLPE
jgi:hypothetical protein